MNNELQRPLIGLTSAKYGITSLVLAGLALASPLLIVTVGIFLFFVAGFFLVSIGVVCGVVAVIKGMICKDRVGVLTGSIALVGFVIFGFVFMSLISAMKNF